MEISKELAKQIVTAVFEVVKNDINLINASGIIIGSTNEERTGSFHQAGARAAALGEPVKVEADNLFQGTRKGINYPIFLEEGPIAVIGITGEPEEMEQYGFLVTKITEVFLKEQLLNEEIVSENRSLHYLVTSLIYGQNQNQRQFSLLLEKYKIDRMGEFAVMSVQLRNPSLEQSLYHYFKHTGCQMSAYIYPSEWVVIFDRSSYQRFQADAFKATYKEQVYAGLGNFGTLSQTHQSYRSAVTARSHARSQGLTFESSDHISIDYVLENLPADIRRLYISHTLENLSEKDCHVLEVYFRNNLSLKDAAASLFIHKNTLQYQLDRITEKSGLNPRTFQDAFLLQFALFCDTC